MNKDVVNLPKKKPPVLQLVLGIIIAAVFWKLFKLIALTWSLAFLWYFLLSVLVFYCIDFFYLTVRYYTDPEKIVDVRKKSLENTAAKDLIAYKHKIFNRALLARNVINALVATLVCILGTYYKVDKGSQWQAIMLMAFIIIFFSLQIDKVRNSKINKRYTQFSEECDYETLFDYIELYRLDIVSAGDRRMINYLGITSCFHLEDYETMFLKGQKLGEFKYYDALEIFKFMFEGAACIKSDNIDGFNLISDKLGRIEKRVAKKSLMVKECAKARLFWNLMIAWKKNDLEGFKLIDNTIDESIDSIKKDKGLRMERLYMLADLQEKNGLIQLAEQNYKIVAEEPKTMAVKDHAIERLNRIAKVNE